MTRSSEQRADPAVTGRSLCAVQDLLSLRRLVLVDSTLPPRTRRFHPVHHLQKQFSANPLRFIAHGEAA